MADTDAKIVIHHVGGRAGSMPFKIPSVFRDSTVAVLYDADPDCFEQMKESAEQNMGEFRVLPYFLGRQRGRSAIHINYDPYTSSASDLDPRYAGFYLESHDHDYNMGEAFRHVETRQIEVTSLDEVISASGNSIPPPDFMSADVCGLSHDVFLGARQALGKEVLGIIDNIFMQPVHLGQTSLHDHCRLFHDLGFEFVGFTGGLMEFSPHRAPVGQRGKGYILGADTLFLRRPETMEATFPEQDRRYSKYYKLAFIALRFGYVEFALKLMDAVRGLEPSDRVRAKVAATSYGRFLEKLGGVAGSMQRQFPPTFSEVYTFAQSRNRFVAGAKVTHQGLKGWLKVRLLPHRRLHGVAKRVRNAACVATGNIRAMGRSVKSVVSPRYSAFERVLADYGLVDVAELVRDRRLRVAV